MPNLFAAESLPAIEPDNVPEFYVTEAPIIDIRDGTLCLGFSRDRNGDTPVVKVRIVAPLSKAIIIGERIRDVIAEHQMNRRSH